MDNDRERTSKSLEDYWAIARRRKWWLIVPLLVTWALVIVASRFIPPKFRSETVIIVEQSRAAEQFILPNTGADVQGRLQSMTQQILSRTRLLGIINHFHLYGQNKGAVDSDATVERMRDDIKIELVPAPGRPWELSAFKVSYSAPTPVLAQSVTNELTSLFIVENVRNRERISENTTEFLDSQLQQARKELDEQEKRLRDFKSKYLGELPEQLQNDMQVVAGLQTRLQAAQEALDEATQQELYLESLLAQYGGLRQYDNQTGDTLVAGTTVDDQLDKLRTELTDLSSRYTPNHPDVRRVTEKIATLEKLKQKLDSQNKSEKADGSVSRENISSGAELRALSPLLQLEGQLKANKLKIAHREHEVKRLEQQIEAYQSRLNLMPVREQELGAITRDHQQSRANYESLLAKKTQSEMATNLEKRQQGELFTIVDPPNLPQKPYKPDRFKLSLLGFAMGVFLSLGITYLLETLDARIYRDEDLWGLNVPAPVLVGIPVLQTPSEQRKQLWYRRIETVAISALLAAVPVMTLLTLFRG